MNKQMEKHSPKPHTDKEALKERIARQAAKSFALHGIKAVRMDDIAAAEGISKRTLYELYADKETLLLEVMQRHYETERAYMTGIIEKADNVMEIILHSYQRATHDLQSVNRLFFEELKFYPRIQAFLSEHRQNGVEAIRRFYQKGVDEGLFHSDINYGIVCVMVREQIDSLLDSEACKEYSMAEIYRTVALTHIRGIATEKGLQKMHDLMPDFEL